MKEALEFYESDHATLTPQRNWQHPQWCGYPTEQPLLGYTATKKQGKAKKTLPLVLPSFTKHTAFLWVKARRRKSGNAIWLLGNINIFSTFAFLNTWTHKLGTGKPKVSICWRKIKNLLQKEITYYIESKRKKEIFCFSHVNQMQQGKVPYKPGHFLENDLLNFFSSIFFTLLHFNNQTWRIRVFIWCRENTLSLLRFERSWETQKGWGTGESSRLMAEEGEVER